MISERSVPRDVVFLVDVRAELPPEKPIRVVEERWIRQNESARPACLFEEGTLVALDDRRTQDSVRKGSAGLSHTSTCGRWVDFRAIDCPARGGPTPAPPRVVALRPPSGRGLREEV